MFDGVYYVKNVPGFELLHGPLLALWTPVDSHGKFFALTGGEVVNYLLSLHQPHLDGFGPTPTQPKLIYAPGSPWNLTTPLFFSNS